MKIRGRFARTARVALAAVLVAWFSWMAPASAQQTLTVYSALDQDQFGVMMAAFEAMHPDITVNKIIDSNGPTIARLLAEKGNPQADILFGAAVSGLLVLDEAGILEPYKPNGIENIKPKFMDQANDPPLWVGLDAWADAICFNTTEAAARGLPKPATWNDLLKPEFKGQVAMPNPNSSGTGLLAVAGWLKIFGEEGGWAYMDKLHENIAQYVHSGSKPCRMAAGGEIAVGISYPAPGVKAITDGAPLEVILPSDGLGVEIEGVALIKGSKNPEAAKLLADFAVSRAAADIALKYYPVVAYKGVTASIPNYPENEEALMLDMDFKWLAANRERILTEWQRRYGVKDAPK